MITRRVLNRFTTTWTSVRPARRKKVFGIGLPKTGTTSLGYCFRRLGYKHRSFDMDLAAQVKRNQLENVLAEAERHEAFEDWPWFSIYRELDERFPNSKFILTHRKDTETYIKSLKGHHEREGIRQENFIKPAWWDVVFGVEPDEWDYQKSAERYERHNREVLKYFANRREDLLVACWETGDGWATLTNFLHKRCPNEPFPHLR